MLKKRYKVPCQTTRVDGVMELGLNQARLVGSDPALLAWPCREADNRHTTSEGKMYPRTLWL